MKFLTVAEMIAIEKEADANGHSYEEMMTQAGLNLAKVVDDVYGDLEDKIVLGLVGKGNNGGDTLVALAHLCEAGWEGTAYLVSKRPKKDPLVKVLREAGGKIVAFDEDPDHEGLVAALDECAVLLDGVLGTGIKLPLKSAAAEVLGFINAYFDDNPAPEIIAVDCPSGIDCETGETADETLWADITVTMAAVKRGMLALPAFEYLGDIAVVGIGLPEDLPGWEAVNRGVVDEDLAAALLPPRPLDAHKGTFGRAVIAAGSANYTGAALLSGKAAFRSGAGWVTLAVPSMLHSSLAGHFPEATWLLLPHEMGVISDKAARILRDGLERATALLIGPGLGAEDTTQHFIARLLDPVGPKPRIGIGFVKIEKENAVNEKRGDTLPPLVVDADGLKLLAKIENWAEKLPGPAILTPHPGEMSVLTGLDREIIQNDRLAAAEKFAQEWGHVVVLKGPFTLIAAPDGRTALIPVATPALARAGTGDVLAGLITGFRAQGLEAFEAAVAGAWIHAQAGLIAEETLGGSAAVLAGDVLDAVPEVLESLDS